MRCEEYRDWMERRLDQDLSTEEGHMLDHHLTQCPACAKEMEELHTLSLSLSQPWPEVHPPSSPADAVLAQIAQEDQPVTRRDRRFGKKPWWWVGGTVAAAVLSLWFLPLTETPPSSQPPNHVAQPPQEEPGGSNQGGMGIQGEPSPSDPGIQKAPSDQGQGNTRLSSPGGEYQAYVEGRHIQVQDQKGLPVFTSKEWKENQHVDRMVWTASNQLVVWLRSSGGEVEVRSINVEEQLESIHQP